MKVIIGGATAVLVFDVLASLASSRFGLAYGAASVGSCIIYLAIGYLAARTSALSPVRHAAAAAALAGLVDASAGWAIAWQMGPGQLPAGVALTPARWVSTAVVVVALAAAVGALGGIAGRSRSTINVPAA